MFFSEYSIEWQHVLLLMYSLDNITGGIPTRQQTTEYIQNEGLLQHRDGDNIPYPSQSEPSWCTDIAWARKNAVILGYVNNHEWNSWDISRTGREFLQQTLSKGSQGNLQVGRCFLWSPVMKRRFDPTYSPSSNDLIAPPKGKRSLPNIGNLRQLFSDLSSTVPLTELAAGFSRVLGVSIPATAPSLAFAWWTIQQNKKNGRPEE